MRDKWFNQYKKKKKNETYKRVYEVEAEGCMTFRPATFRPATFRPWPEDRQFYGDFQASGNIWLASRFLLKHGNKPGPRNGPESRKEETFLSFLK